MQSIHCRLPALGLPSVAQPPVHSSIDEPLHGRQHSSPLTSLRRHPEARLLPHKAPFSCYSSSPPLPQRTAKAATGQALDRVPIHAVQGTAVWEPAQAVSTPLQKHLSHTLTAFSPQAVTDHAVPPGPRPGPLLQLARGRRRPRPALHPRPRLLQFLLCPHHPVARPTRVLMSCSALSTFRGKDSDPGMICGAASALMTALNIDSRRVVAVGHSMGAIVASELARSLDLLGVVLIGPVNPNEALVDVFEARTKLVDAGGMEGVAAVVPSAATGPKATATQQAFIRTLLLAQSPEGYKSLCRTIQRANRPQYEDIKCPLLIIAGSHDKTSPLGGSEHIFWGAGESQKRLEVLQGVGHWHCIEAAEEVLGLVSGFAAQLRDKVASTS
ncbi:alpha/beta hydrolase [Purpureocillium lilacinum]|uniref:Alpha/beta hydrolase n=1 Tax=Purpureocillium lilacinum TaxID=33203 RepID=A0A179HQZ0_PURLI|nr:alpha/beta hydrolase [Purpureocillium lilacinum]OAQ92855.1 alpha/beta hydrolase [Purpureocillium lilacinum]